MTIDEATDDVRMAALLADQRAIHPPGEQLIYHALTFGWLCGEIVRRIDGRSVGRFFADEVAAPLGLDAWIGLPAEHEPRVAVIERDGELPADQQDVDGVAWSIWRNPPRFSGAELAANLPAWHAAEVPASSGIADARSLARMYGALPGLVSEATLTAGRATIAHGHDPYLQAPMAFGAGFQLQTEQPWFGPPASGFGHCGTGGSVHGAWPELRTGFSYTMNLARSSDGVDPRPARLLDALHAAVTR